MSKEVQGTIRNCNARSFSNKGGILGSALTLGQDLRQAETFNQAQVSHSDVNARVSLISAVGEPKGVVQATQQCSQPSPTVLWVLRLHLPT